MTIHLGASGGDALSPGLPQPSGTRRPRRMLGALPAAVWASLAVVLVLVLAITLPAALGAGDPNATDPLLSLLPPSAEHWFGTDELGRDLYARVVHGARYSVVIGVLAVVFAVIVGGALGLLAALGGTVVDEVLSRIFDLLSAFPSILMALLFATFFGRGTLNLTLAVGIAIIPAFGRIIRRQALAIRGSDFVTAAVTFGESRVRIVLRHVLPNVFTSVLLLAAIEVGVAILTVSGISFVGLGPERPAPEWGSLLAEGRSVAAYGWWPTVFPGVSIVVTILACTTLGRYLQRRLERRLVA
ncbi:ABC transporter permease [Leucobacter rhizosphaerae]|uniref:ABC transporter permease n=1 Tax=Leucobacter rhizosphaerae TaxID=2932245 RepID=A0ABY4FTZ3_9MICO|nr:ABC transporter permease [Leucobacter rhizosphaerae]UOQ59716.1 ABC transporter permease [Leucobacter rhizosphaerae]